MSDTRPTETILSAPYRRASIAIYTTIALAAFEGTAVISVLPEVAGDLGRLDLLPWVVTGYLFASGVATIVAGPLVDALGSRVVFRWAVTLFTIAGTVAGLVTSMPMMVGVRLVHGVGGGLLFAVGLAAVSLVFPPNLVGRAFAANSTVWGVVGIGAPAIAAFLVTVLSWRWVFLVNLPLGAIALAAGWSTLPEAPERSAGRAVRVDVVGTLLVATFVMTSLLAVEQLGLGSLAWGAVALVAVAGYVAHARRRTDPVVRHEHVFAQPYSTLGLTVALMVMAAFSANAYVTLYVSTARGAGPALTAWSVFFFVIGWTVGANLSSRLLDRFAETSVMALGTGLTIPGLVVVMLGARFTWPLAIILGALFVAGSGIGNATNAGLTLLRAMTADGAIGRASSAHQFIRNLGFTFGSALGGAVLLVTIGGALGGIDEVESLLAGTSQPGGADVAAAVASGYSAVALAATFGAVLALIPLFALRRHLADARAVRRGRLGDAGPRMQP